jgi:hypothetical protein
MLMNCLFNYARSGRAEQKLGGSAEALAPQRGKAAAKLPATRSPALPIRHELGEA